MDAADMPEPAGEPEVVEDGGRRVAGCPAFLLQSREDPQQTGSGAGVRARIGAGPQALAPGAVLSPRQMTLRDACRFSLGGREDAALQAGRWTVTWSRHGRQCSGSRRRPMRTDPLPAVVAPVQCPKGRLWRHELRTSDLRCPGFRVDRGSRAPSTPRGRTGRTGPPTGRIGRLIRRES